MNANQFTIQNFDKQISVPILQRGVQYYNDGLILDIEENEGNWIAEVEGTDIYTVTVSLTNDNEISEYFCDCPYDGNICKHLVAVLFQIREEIQNQELTKKKSAKKSQFEDLLTKINIEEYREFARYYVSKNKDFKTAFELFFAAKDDRIDVSAKYADLVGKLIKKLSSNGFVDYRSSISIAKEINKLINEGHYLAQKGNYRDAFAIASSILKEMMQTLTYCDDSSGSIGETVFNVIELINVIANAEDTAIDMKEHIFVFLETQLNDSIYFDYGDFGYILFSIFEDLALASNKSKAFLGFIDTRLSNLTGRYDNYRKDFFTGEKISFLKNAGREDEAEKLIQQNLDIRDVRQGEVNKAIDKKDFITAKTLITEGIKIAVTEAHSGTVLLWEKELLRIAVLENDLTLVRQYCKQFAFKSYFDRVYYTQWKETYHQDEWKNLIEELINETIQKITNEHKGNKWSSLNAQLLYSLAPVYIEEKYWDRLLELVKKEDSLEKIIQYHNYLLQQYPAELLQIYLPLLARQGDNANNRSQYAELVKIMKKIIKDIPVGKEQIIAIAQNLKTKYPRRPAMIDELENLLQ